MEIEETATKETKTTNCTSELISHLNLLQVARGHNDRRLVSRVLQHLPQIRRQLTANILINLIENSSISGKTKGKFLLIPCFLFSSIDSDNFKFFAKRKF